MMAPEFRLLLAPPIEVKMPSIFTGWDREEEEELFIEWVLGDLK